METLFVSIATTTNQPSKEHQISASSINELQLSWVPYLLLLRTSPARHLHLYGWMEGKNLKASQESTCL